MSDPRIIVWDLETTPDLREAHRIWPQLSSRWDTMTLKAQVSSILCFGWKVFGEDKSEVKCAWEYPTWKSDPNDDREIAAYAREILQGADAIVTQNGRRFDFPFLQTRLFKWELPLLDKRIIHIDTKVSAKGNLSMVSNSLNNLGRFLLSEEKKKHDGWDMWDDVRFHPCPLVRQQQQETMKEYCRQDVLLLEKLYRRLRPFTEGPNHNLFDPMRAKSCPECGSTRLHSNGFRTTKTQKYKRYICQDCGRQCRTDMKDEVPR